MLDISLMLRSSQQLELLKDILYLLRYDIKCEKYLGKNLKMHCQERFEVIFSIFYFLGCNKITPY
jgi:hypothetical protein